MNTSRGRQRATTTRAAIESVGPSPVATSNCVNCGAEFFGPYCSACGQHVPRGRHTVRGFVAGAFSRLFSVERGLTHTIVRLTVKPGEVVRDYLAGRTTPYTHPFAYLIVSFALFVITLRFFPGAMEGGDSRALVGASVVFIALASRLVFWQSGLNYAEHLILNVFLFAHAVLLLVPAVVLISLAPGAAAGVAVVFLVGVTAFFVWSYSRIFRRPGLAALGSLLVLALGSALWLAAVAAFIRWRSSA